MDTTLNEFYSYGYDEIDGVYHLMVYDLERNPHEVLTTKSKKLSDYLIKHFDDMAISDETELFDESVKII